MKKFLLAICRAFRKHHYGDVLIMTKRFEKELEEDGRKLPCQDCNEDLIYDKPVWKCPKCGATFNVEFK